jgi:hypothetical protein
MCSLVGDHLWFRVVFRLGKYDINVLSMSEICAKKIKFISLALSWAKGEKRNLSMTCLCVPWFVWKMFIYSTGMYVDRSDMMFLGICYHREICDDRIISHKKYPRKQLAEKQFMFLNILFFFFRNITVFWDVMLCVLVDIYQCFGTSCSFHFQVRSRDGGIYRTIILPVVL